MTKIAAHVLSVLVTLFIVSLFAPGRVTASTSAIDLSNVGQFDRMQEIQAPDPAGPPDPPDKDPGGGGDGPPDPPDPPDTPRR